jgi:hypothetical protein
MTAHLQQHADELVAEAISNHAASADRVALLISELHAELSNARQAYATAQAILTAAGEPQRTAYLRTVPSIEQTVKDGGLMSLIDHRDRLVAA